MVPKLELGNQGWRLHLARLCVGLALALAAHCASGADYQTGTPFVYLFDTGAPSPRPLGRSQLTAKAGWSPLPEDRLAHTFRGDAVLLNDKLTVVLRRDGPGAEVYSQTPIFPGQPLFPGQNGPKYRLVLIPLSHGSRSLKGWSALKILENGRGAVMLQTTLQTTQGGRLSVTWRLTTGQQILEVRPGESAHRLVVWGKSRYVVVPDFFADDMVFGPAAFDLSRLPHSRLMLPAENFLLSLLEGGDAMAMCVWESGGSVTGSNNDAHAQLWMDGDKRVIGGCEIQCRRDKPVWVALIESPGIWHRRALSSDDAGREIVLDWKPPFAARWRADFVRPDGDARSWDFADVLPADQRQPHGPCRFDADRAMVQVPSDGEQPSPDEPFQRSILVYPIDRSRATPLTAFCPTDVLRNTLGIGPCQYILQTEGLASDTNPGFSGNTPAQAMDWIEKQFKRKKASESADQIRELLDQMIEHVGHTQARIRRYAALAREVRALCTAGQQDANVLPVAETLLRVVDRLQQAVAAGRDSTEPIQHAASLAAEIVELIGKDNALAECERLGAKVRRIGAAADRTLSKCRMTVRWLRQRARMLAAGDSPDAKLARTVQDRAQRFLQGK